MIQVGSTDHSSKKELAPVVKLANLKKEPELNSYPKKVPNMARESVYMCAVLYNMYFRE